MFQDHRQCQTVFTEKNTTIFHVSTNSREIIVFNFGFFMDLLRESFQTQPDYNFGQDLAVHARFDNLDLISWLQACQNRKLPVVFRLVSTVV